VLSWIRRLLAVGALVALGVIGLNHITSWRGAQTGAQPTESNRFPKW
jgi:hypothetical protein